MKRKSKSRRKRPHVPTLAEKRKANKAFRELLRRKPDLDVLMRAMKRYFAECARSRSHPAKERELALNVSRVLTRAAKVLGSEFAGNRWMITPQPALGNRMPWSLLRSERGRKKITELLVGIAAGNFQ